MIADPYWDWDEWDRILCSIEKKEEEMEKWVMARQRLDALLAERESAWRDRHVARQEAQRVLEEARRELADEHYFHVIAARCRALGAS